MTFIASVLYSISLLSVLLLSNNANISVHYNIIMHSVCCSACVIVLNALLSSGAYTSQYTYHFNPDTQSARQAYSAGDTKRTRELQRVQALF